MNAMSKQTVIRFFFVVALLSVAAAYMVLWGNKEDGGPNEVQGGEPNWTQNDNEKSSDGNECVIEKKVRLQPELTKIAGRVTDNQEESLEGVTCSLLFSTGERVYEAETDEDGNFEFNVEFKEDIKYVLFELDCHFPRTVGIEYFLQEGGNGTVSLCPAGVINLVIELGEVGEIPLYRILVVNKDGEYYVLELEETENISGLPTTELEKGMTPSLNSVAATSYWDKSFGDRLLSSESERFLLREGEWKVRIVPEDLPHVESGLFEIAAGQETDVVVTLILGGCISGTCVNTSGEPVSNVSIEAWPVGFRQLDDEREHFPIAGDTMGKGESNVFLRPCFIKSDMDGGFVFSPLVNDVDYRIYCRDYEVYRFESNYDWCGNVVKPGTIDLRMVIKRYPRLIIDVDDRSIGAEDAHAFISVLRLNRKGVEDGDADVVRYDASIKEWPGDFPLFIWPPLSEEDRARVEVMLVAGGERMGEGKTLFDFQSESVYCGIFLEKVFKYNLGKLPSRLEEVKTWWDLIGVRTDNAKFTATDVQQDDMLSDNTLGEYTTIYRKPVLYVVNKRNEARKSCITTKEDTLLYAVVWHEKYEGVNVCHYTGSRKDKSEEKCYDRKGKIAISINKGEYNGSRMLVTVRAKVPGYGREKDLVIGKWNIRLPLKEKDVKRLERTISVKVRQNTSEVVTVEMIRPNGIEYALTVSSWDTGSRLGINPKTLLEKEFVLYDNVMIDI